MELTDAETFFSSIGGFNPTPLAEAFNFTAGSNIDVQQKTSANSFEGITAEGLAEFLGLSCIYYITTDINSDTISAKIDIRPFSMGNGNIQAKNITIGTNMRVNLDITAKETTGSMDATVIFWSIERGVAITFDDLTISFVVSDNIYKGIYTMELTVEAETTTDIATADVTVTGVLSDDDILKFNEDMEKLMSEWIDQGVYTLQLSESLVDSQSIVVSNAESRQCSESCPIITVCTTPTTTFCIDYTYAIECLENSLTCDSLSLYCNGYTVLCLQTETYCSGYEKNLPNVCKEFITECTNTVEVCDGYTLDCIGEVEGNCEIIEFVSTGECGSLDFRCNSTEVEEPQCRANCLYEKLVFEEERIRLESYQATDDATQSDLGGFRDLYELEDVIEIKSGTFTRKLDESGIGPRDIFMDLVISLPDITTDDFFETTITIAWDSYDQDVNLDSIYLKSKEAIIERSSNTMTIDLLRISPLEVFYEN